MASKLTLENRTRWNARAIRSVLLRMAAKDVWRDYPTRWRIKYGQTYRAVNSVTMRHHYLTVPRNTIDAAQIALAAWLCVNHDAAPNIRQRTEQLRTISVWADKIAIDRLPEPRKPARNEKLSKEIAHVSQLIKNWERRQKLASTKLKKLNARLKRLTVRLARLGNAN